MDPKLFGTRSAYFSPVTITPDCWSELCWWQESLGPQLHYQEQVSDYSMTGIMIGDGSGTGAGGSLSFHHNQISTNTGMETWMGTWISTEAQSQSSNWRELRTLLEFFHRENQKNASLFQS